MLRVKNIIKKIIKYMVICINVFFIYLYGIFTGIAFKKDIWIISEVGDTARDNGYCFFRYMRENHITKNVYYLIDINCHDYEKVKPLGNVINYNSMQHKAYFIFADKIISTHKNKIEIFPVHKLNKYFGWLLRKKKVAFIQHGIIQNDISNVYGEKVSNFSLFTTACESEYKFVLENFGYGSDVIKKTGLARYDYLEDISTENTILLMPTWRKNIVQPTWIKEEKVGDEVFLNSEYFKTYNDLLNNKELHVYLNLNKIKIVFYPHYQIHRYLKYFKSDCKNITIINSDENDIQDLLVHCKLLITDFSSVNFDFAFMKKPIIYYQFDKQNYYDNHQTKGYFDFEQMGFGPVIEKQNELIKEIKNIADNKYKLNDKYIKRVDSFFDIRDRQNCFRIYKEIEKF